MLKHASQCIDDTLVAREILRFLGRDSHASDVPKSSIGVPHMQPWVLPERCVENDFGVVGPLSTCLAFDSLLFLPFFVLSLSRVEG